jgi:hypothetical protein
LAVGAHDHAGHPADQATHDEKDDEAHYQFLGSLT